MVFMGLRNKIILFVLIVLLMQAGISAFFTLRTFSDHADQASRQELQDGWKRARYSVERLRHRLYRDATHYRGSLPLEGHAEHTTESLIMQLQQYIGTSDADRILLVTQDNHILLDLTKGIQQDISLQMQHISLDDFRFPRNRYISVPGTQGVSLYLVTGTPVSTEEGVHWLFLINDVNRSFIQTIIDETGTRAAFFDGDVLAASDLPRGSGFNPFAQYQRIHIGDIPYSVLSRPISTDLPDLMYMAAFKSDLSDQLYIRRTLTTFLTAFLFTLTLSVLLAALMTSYAVQPFSKLYRWIKDYQAGDKGSELDITGTDEIGFLARTFQSMIRRLIDEERIIRNQLSEISFLHNYNNAIVSTLQAGIMVLDNEGRIEYSNHYLNSLLNTSQDSLVGMDGLGMIKHNFQAPAFSYRSQLSTPVTQFIDNLSYHSTSGEMMKFVAKVVPLEHAADEQKTLVVLEDITRTDQLWQKVLIAEKISSLGLLSAGMAHEINNPLGSILSHIHYLRSTEEDPEKMESLQWIERESQRIEKNIRRILRYARPSSSSEQCPDLNCVIKETLELISFELDKRNISVITQLAETQLPAENTEDELKQIILNLLINSYQAMEHGGQITISTKLRHARISCTISDTGKGISREHLPHIFDPFYSTKHQESGGTGLGLTIIYSILRRNEGDIHVDSTPDKGTQIRLTLKRGNDI